MGVNYSTQNQPAILLIRFKDESIVITVGYKKISFVSKPVTRLYAKAVNKYLIRIQGC